MTDEFGKDRPYAYVHMSAIHDFLLDGPSLAGVALVESLIGGVEYASRRDRGPVFVPADAFTFGFPETYDLNHASKLLRRLFGPWSDRCGVARGLPRPPKHHPVFVIVPVPYAGYLPARSNVIYFRRPE